MYLIPTQNHWACDIEADDLLPGVSRVWCVCLINCITKEEVEFTDADSLHTWQGEHPDAIYVGHNFITYDAVVLNRFYSAKIPITRIVDTFVLSQLYNPSYAGGHSLKKWGERLKYPKGEFDDFSQLTPEMLLYCRRDARLTALLFIKLSERMRSVSFTERGCEIEHLAWNIIQNRQKKNGFQFDFKKGTELYLDLRRREAELKDEIYKLWPPQKQLIQTYKGAMKKDGTPSAQYLRHKGQFLETRLVADNQYEVWDMVEFNLGSPMQRIDKLLEMGWKPVAKTDAGNPKVDEDELLAFAESSGTPEVKALATWVVCNSRANMVKNWLDNYNEETHAIHGSLFIASTLRYKHSSPNSANIPGVRTKKVNDEDVVRYGEDGAWAYECRDLYTSGGDDWTLVGIDGKGMQLRCLAHNVAKVVGQEACQAFIDDLLVGDPHKKNMAIHGFPSKPAAKKAIYTILMGGGNAKIAADQVQFGWQPKASLKDDVIDSIPGFRKLISALQADLRKTGRITLCDGTPILVPSDHMVIPYLLQGDESRLMKQAMIYVEQAITERRWRQLAFKQCDVHDEWQYRIKTEIVDDFITTALPMFPKAGDSFNYNILIEGDAKCGRTWAETH